MQGNGFKQALAERRVQIGIWAALADAYATEIVASAGFDWLVIDGEHAPNDLRTVLAQLQACAAYTVEPVVRLPVGDAVLVNQVMDLGARTLLVPMVESAAHTAALVRAMRYPPAGTRGVGLARASRWGTDAGYVARANDEACLLVQVETAAGLRALEAIAATEGVDCVFFGPYDLSASLGIAGGAAAAETVEVVTRAVQQVVALGKAAAGVIAVDPAAAERYLASGVTFCAVGVDAAMLAGAARGLVGRFREAGGA